MCDVSKVMERGLCDICRVFIMIIKILLFLQLLRILVLLKSFTTVFVVSSCLMVERFSAAEAFTECLSEVSHSLCLIQSY